jgi:predicted aspartyl protease
MQRQPLAFTTTYNRITRVLANEVYVSQAFNRSSFPTPPKPEDIGAKKFVSIWDTGATGTVISQKVIDECGLKPISLARVNTASQKDVLTTVYFVSIMLPNKIIIPQLRVIKGSIAGGADVLIGMDIISNGDFSVTNCEGKTVFSFRIPSIEAIDYVKQGKVRVPQTPSPPRKVGRNAPCPCGSGKKYKHCCGK